MIEHLIVPLDGSAFSEQVLPLAMRLAQASEADVHLVHVHVPRPPDMFLTEATLGVEGVDIGAWDDERRGQSRAYLEEIAVGLRGEHAPEIHTAWLEGAFEEEIDHYGASLESALILTTSHGRTGLSRFWLGSATDALVRTTRVPVLVAHPDPEGDADTVLLPALDHILVPLDGSTESASVLTPAAALARATGARITLFHVVSSDDLIGGPILPVLVRSLPESLERAREHLERRAETLRRSGLDVDVDVAHGQMPARAIAREAEERGVDLVAMSTHGYGGVRRFLLGSVTDKVLRGIALPLLLQRPD